VSQESSLFSRPISENVRYGYEEANGREIASAIEDVGATSLIASQPQGYETEVGDRGA